MKSKYQEIQGPKVSADPSLEGAPSEKDIKKEISKNLVDGVSKLLGGKENKDEPTKDSKETVSDSKKPSYVGQQTEKLFDPKEFFSEMSPQKALKLIGSVVMLFIIVAAVYVRFIRKEPVRNDISIVSVPTPTYGYTGPNRIPSIYADDPDFKSIAEGMEVLQNESITTPLEETTLQPPNLDYNIGFKGVEVKK